MTNLHLDQNLRGGFARIPDAFFRAPVSASARFLLFFFCGAANEAGESWYSYEQLGELLNRSRSSVSGYVKELREAGYIACIQQKTSMGFNYRLKIRIVGWGRILEYWRSLAEAKTTRCRTSGKAEQERTGAPVTDGEAASVDADLPTKTEHRDRSAERAVQQDERNKPIPDINNTHPTQSPDASASGKEENWNVRDEEAWRNHRPSENEAFGNFYGTPDPVLLKRLIRHADALAGAAGLIGEPEARRLALAEVQQFCGDKRLRATQEEIAAAATAIGKTARTRSAISGTLSAIAEAWQPHWRRLPDDVHLERAARAAMDRRRLPRLDEAYIFLTRAAAARHWLKCNTGSEGISIRATAA